MEATDRPSPDDNRERRENLSHEDENTTWRHPRAIFSFGSLAIASCVNLAGSFALNREDL